MLSKLNSPLQPSSDRKCGRWREQLKSRDGTPPPTKRCKWAEGLLGEWAEGLISAPRVQRHAFRLLEDGVTLPAVHRLAKLGGGRDHKAHHDLLNLLDKIAGIDDFISSCEGSNITEWVRPSTIYGMLHNRNPSQFKLRLGAKDGGVSEFWEGLFSSAEGRELRDNNEHLRGKTPADLKYI